MKKMTILMSLSVLEIETKHEELKSVVSDPVKTSHKKSVRPPHRFLFLPLTLLLDSTAFFSRFSRQCIPGNHTTLDFLYIYRIQRKPFGENLIDPMENHNKKKRTQCFLFYCNF